MGASHNYNREHRYFRNGNPSLEYNSWAGQANNEWWKGIVIKRELDNCVYEP